MRRILVVGTVALAVAVAACGGDAEASGVDGRLQVIGSAYPGVNQATAGTVVVYPAGAELVYPAGAESPPVPPLGLDPFAELAVDATGEFRISLAPGTYLLAAKAVGGYVWATQLVEVNPGQFTSITITCFR
jgi:hypothetical protein